MAKGKKQKKSGKPKKSSPKTAAKKGKPTKKKAGKARPTRAKVKKQKKGAAKPAEKKARAGKPKKAKVKDIPAFIAGLPGNPEVKEVPISDIDLDNKQYQLRGSLRIGDLSRNIANHGQKIPVILRGQKPPFQIISGFRRIAAIDKIGWKKVNAIILPRIGDEEAFKLSILENEFRKTYNDLDRAGIIQRYREMGKKIEEIEDVFNLKKRRIMYLQKLLEFEKVLQNALGEGKISTEHAITLQTYKNKNQDLDLKHWIKRVVEEELSYRKLRKALKQELGKESAQPKSVSLFVEKKDDQGHTYLRFWPGSINPKGLSKDQLRQVQTKLKRALEFVEKALG